MGGDDTNSVNTVNNQQRPLSVFLERVTIQGFEEYRRSTNPFERLFWAIIILTAFGCFIRDGMQLVSETFAGRKLSRYDWELVDSSSGLVLPNVSVCAPIDFNKTRMSELFFIAPEIMTSQVVKENNLTRAQIIEELAAYYAPHSLERSVQTQIERILRRIFSDPANEALSNDTSSLIRSLSPPCTAMLGECHFNGKPFSCCDIAVFSSLDGYTCYKLPLDASSHGFIQSSQGPRSGVSFSAYFDHSHVSHREAYSDALDGFLIMVGQEPTFLSSPIAAWPGSHVEIRVNGRRKISYQQCKYEADLKYFDHYDTDGAYCIGEYFTDKLYLYVGCHLPGYGYLPNASIACDANTFPLLGKANAMSMDTSWQTMMKEKYGNDEFMERAKKYFGDLFGELDATSVLSSFHRAGVCSPLCDQWKHRLDVSYSSLQQGTDQWKEPITSSIRMTRITVFYGELSYEVFREQPFVEVYSLFYSIGGLGGFYIGASIITFVQLITFGLWCTGAYATRFKEDDH